MKIAIFISALYKFIIIIIVIIIIIIIIIIITLNIQEHCTPQAGPQEKPGAFVMSLSNSTVLEEYKDCFDKIGIFPDDKYHIQLIDNPKSVVHPARSVPVHKLPLHKMVWIG